MFTEKEMAYMMSQPLARLATVNSTGQPDNAAVAFELVEGIFYIGGMDIARSRKGRNVSSGNERVALIIDDLETADPWLPRGVRVYGRAQLVERQGRFGSGTYLRIVPQVSWSWSIEGPAMQDGRFVTNRTEHDPDRTVRKPA